MNVEHDEAGRRFVIRAEGSEGELTYRREGDGVLNLMHTGVDPDLRGEGAASALVRSAFEYAREQNLRVVPSCSYVRAWVERHPDQQDIVDY